MFTEKDVVRDSSGAIITTNELTLESYKNRRRIFKEKQQEVIEARIALKDITKRIEALEKAVFIK